MRITVRKLNTIIIYLPHSQPITVHCWIGYLSKSEIKFYIHHSFQVNLLPQGRYIADATPYFHSGYNRPGLFVSVIPSSNEGSVRELKQLKIVKSGSAMYRLWVSQGRWPLKQKSSIRLSSDRWIHGLLKVPGRRCMRIAENQIIWCELGHAFFQQ